MLTIISIWVDVSGDDIRYYNNILIAVIYSQRDLVCAQLLFEAKSPVIQEVIHIFGLFLADYCLSLFTRLIIFWSIIPMINNEVKEWSEIYYTQTIQCWARVERLIAIIE